MATVNYRTGSGRGFTLVELIVSLMVTALILVAVVSLAYGLSSANDAATDTSRRQAQLRLATLRISESIRHCRLICGAPLNDLAIWRADDDGDNKMDVVEIVYIDTGEDRDCLRLLEFTSCPAAFATWFANQTWGIWAVGYHTSGFKNTLINIAKERYTTLIPECSNVEFALDKDPATPHAKFVSVTFDVDENGATQSYQINAAIQGRCYDHFVDRSNYLIGEDDD